MQEEVENRTVNLAISTTKLTGRTIIAGIRKYLQHREKVKMKKARDPAVHGKQSVKQLLGQNQGATNVEIDKESILCTQGSGISRRYTGFFSDNQFRTLSSSFGVSSRYSTSVSSYSSSKSYSPRSSFPLVEDLSFMNLK